MKFLIVTALVAASSAAMVRSAGLRQSPESVEAMLRRAPDDLQAMVRSSLEASLRNSDRVHSAGLRDMPDSLQAWYDFNGKFDCVVDSIDKNSQEIRAASKKIVSILKKHPALETILRDFEAIDQEVDKIIADLKEEIEDVSWARLPGKIYDNAKRIIAITGRSVAVAAKIQLLPAQAAIPAEESLDIVSELAHNMDEFIDVVKKVSSDAGDCITN